MPASRDRPRARLRGRLKRAVDAVVGWLAVGAAASRCGCIDPQRMANFAGRLMRRVGPWLPEHAIGRANLARGLSGKVAGGDRDDPRAACGTISAASRPSSPISTGMRDARPGRSRASRHRSIDRRRCERFQRLRDDGKPALVFAAHLAQLGNAGARRGAATGLHAHVLYRAPEHRRGQRRGARDARAAAWARWSPTGLDAPVQARPMRSQRGGHVGMLVDQHYVQRRRRRRSSAAAAKANPLIARLARHVDCPIHGVRVVRLPDGNASGSS